MAISPLHSSILAVQATATAATLQPPANRDVASAVQTLNENGAAGPGRAFSIAIDTKTRVPVVRIVNSETNELIDQIPSQYVLDLAQQINQETASNSSTGGR